MINKYIKEVEESVLRQKLNLEFTKFTLAERMEDASDEEKTKVEMGIEQQTEQLETNEAFLLWLKNQK